VAAGIILLLLAALARFTGRINLPGKLQRTFFLLGIGLLLLGIGVSAAPALVQNGAGRTNAPTILGVTVRKNQDNGGLVYYQEVNFYDDDGNTEVAQWELIDLSDPAQRPFIEVQDVPVDAPPEMQRIRATVTQLWSCEGRTYAATLEVTLVDEDGHRSEPVRYRIDCN
jgi:hypothetical protein